MPDPTADGFLNALDEIVTFAVESRIRLEALENVFDETNPMLHELYIGEIENLRKAKSRQMTEALLAKLKAQLGPR
jgi:hypothetical protein